MSTDNIKSRLAQPEDYVKVMNFIFEHFARDEPLCSCEPKIVLGESNVTDLMDCFKEGMTLLLVQDTEEGEELIGVNIAVSKDPSSIEKYFEVAEMEGNSRTGQMLKMVGVASRKADVFNRYGVDKLFYSYISCVIPKARGQKLGTRLKVELMALGKSLGYKLMTVDCSSFYSAGVCQRLGMDLINYIAYADYVDENNKQIFNPPAPHVGLNSFAIRL